MLAGLLGGLAGARAMNAYWGVVARLRPPTGPTVEDDATVRTASALARHFAHRELSEREKSVAGPAVHYAIGGGGGALLGLLAELAPGRWLARGLSLGALMWLLGDELAVPLLGLSRPPRAYPTSVHAEALGAHAIYGLTADLVRRVVRSAL
jgi:hypothetical protein